jgi:hypothetical protein
MWLLASNIRSIQILSAAVDGVIEPGAFDVFIDGEFSDAVSKPIISVMVGYYRRASNSPTLLVDRISPIVEPFHEAFELARDRLNSIPGLCREEQAWARTWFLRWLPWRG